MADKLEVDTRELDAWLRDLRKAGSELPKTIRTAQKDVVTEYAEEGRTDLASEGHPTQRHVAKLKAIRAAVTGRRAAIRIDAKSRRNAMALGAVLGSRAYPQFPEYRDPGYGWPSTNSYPPFSTVADKADEIVARFLDATTDTLEAEAFPN